MIVKIFEPNSDIEKSTGDVGEICINGPTLMMGYINESKETKDSQTKETDIMEHTKIKVKMKKFGEFTIELYPEYAPETVEKIREIWYNIQYK